MPRLPLVQPVYDNRRLDRNARTIYPLGLAYLAATSVAMNLKSRKSYANLEV